MSYAQRQSIAAGFNKVAEVAHGGGATIPTLVRVSHIHLFGIAFILFFIGKIFLLCDINVIVKRVAVVIPFAAIAYVVIGSGALMGISMGLQILFSVYQMWFYSRK